MISGGNLAEFLVASAIIILAPGPSVMFVIARAVAWGRATAALTALGNSCGLLVQATAIAVGLGPLLQRSHLLLDLVQAGGGLYLIYLGADALRHRREHAADMLVVDGSRPPYGRSVRQGFMVGVLNPKALVFFSAVFPQFVDPAAGSITGQLLVFGLIFSVMGMLMDGAWGVAVGTSRDWFVNSQNRLVVLRTLGGSVMVLLGVLVIIALVRTQLQA